MPNADTAITIFEDGFNCAQSVLALFSDQMGLEERHAYRLACGFGAGMGRKQKTCGAVTGGIMAIGMAYGRDADGTDADKEKTYEVVRQFMHEFEARHGSTECRDLLGCDLTTEEGKKHYIDDHLHETVCVACVSDAVVILDGLIGRH